MSLQTVPRARPNPVRYSPAMLLLITACLLLAEHFSPTVVHGGVKDREVLVEQFNGQLPRQIAYLTLGIIGMLGIAWRRKSTPMKFAANPRILIPLALLLGWCVASLLWSDAPLVSAKRLIVVALMFLGAAGLALSWTRVELLKLIAFSAAAHVTIGLGAEIVLGYFTPWAGDYRFGGTLTWNQQGYLCMLLALAALCLASTVVAAGTPQGQPAWPYRLLAGYAIVMLLLTRSRGALIALAIALLLYFVLAMGSRARMMTLLLAVSLVMTMVVAGLGTRIVTTLNRGGEGSQNFTGRGPLWDELMTYANRHLLLGYGYEGFWTKATIDDVSNHQHWQIDSSHSQYYEALLTLGVVGVILHVLALLAGLVEGIRLYRASGNLLFFLAATLCSIYLLGGFLEAILIVKPSPISFYFAVMLSLLAVRPKSAASSVLLPARRSPRFAPAR